MNLIEIIDLSHTLSDKISIFPGEEIPVIKTIAHLNKDKYREKKMVLFSHHGTHIDCPYHMIQEGFSTESERLTFFFGKGMVVDFREFQHAGLIYPDYLKPYHNQIAETDFILINTGMDRFWRKKEYTESFPVLTTESVEYLCQFSLKGIGTDTLSIDAVNNSDFNNHIMFLSRNIIIIENLKGLEKLVDKNFYFACFPLKIEDGDGSPVRACAFLYQ